MNKKDTEWSWSVNMPCKSLKGFLVLFKLEEPYKRDMDRFYHREPMSCVILALQYILYYFAFSLVSNF